MHDQLLNALQCLASVRLVTALKDERLGFPNANDLRVFIPDIHLISNKRRKEGNFSYITNYVDLLTGIINALVKLRDTATVDETVEVYQLGDFLDLWRESDSPNSDVAAAIIDDNQELVIALTQKLQAKFLLGNHDFDLWQWPNYTASERRYYLPGTSQQASSVMLLHGDIFDWVELFPDQIQNLLVYAFAPLHLANDYELGNIRRLVSRAHGSRNYRNYIRVKKPAKVGLIQSGEADKIPSNWNIQREGQCPQENLKYLDHAYSYCMEANETYQMNLKIAVIGHTHHARIAVRETDDGDLFTLIDCGAWIENCIGYEDTNPTPNAQIAALSGNEARIYQLGPK